MKEILQNFEYQTSKTPTAMIKETQNNIEMKLLKQRPFFVTAKGSGADQKTANKKLPFRKTVYCFGFLMVTVKGDGMPSKHPP